MMTLPQPKYHLFQCVQFTERAKHLEGIITGLEYLSPAVAVAEDLTHDGYLYAIRCEPGFDKSIEELLESPFQAWWVPEADILSVRTKP